MLERQGSESILMLHRISVTYGDHRLVAERARIENTDVSYAWISGEQRWQRWTGRPVRSRILACWLVWCETLSLQSETGPGAPADRFTGGPDGPGSHPGSFIKDQIMTLF